MEHLACQCDFNGKGRGTIELRLSLPMFFSHACKACSSSLRESRFLPVSTLRRGTSFGRGQSSSRHGAKPAFAILSKSQPQFYGTTYLLVSFALTGPMCASRSSGFAPRSLEAKSRTCDSGPSNDCRTITRLPAIELADPRGQHMYRHIVIAFGPASAG